jgi:FixJ family two-component response regulator
MELNVASDVFTHVHETPRTEATVFVVDDDTSVRESLEQLIKTAGWQPETFASAEEFLSFLPHTGPCCVVLDMRLPGLSGLELQEQLAEQLPMPVIFLTGQADVPTTVRAMKAGAVEVLTKPFRSQALLDAIRNALDGSRAALCEKAGMWKLQTCYASLTSRQREVMALVVSGLLNKQIAAELGLSEITVKAHRGRLMRKMAADSLPDLVMMAATLGVAPRSRSSTPVGPMLPNGPGLRANRVAADRHGIYTPPCLTASLSAARPFTHKTANA